MTAFRIGLLMAVALLGADLSAEDFESKAPKLVVERPIASGPPTDVTIGIYLLDIDEIDDINQLFSVDMFVNITWQDPR